MVKVGIMLLSPPKYSAANLNFTQIKYKLLCQIIDRVWKTCPICPLSHFNYLIQFLVKLRIFSPQIHESFCSNDFHCYSELGVEYRHFGQNPRSNKQKSNCCEKKLVIEWCTSLLLNKELDKFTQEVWIGLNEALGSFLFVSFLLFWFYYNKQTIDEYSTS